MARTTDQRSACFLLFVLFLAGEPTDNKVQNKCCNSLKVTDLGALCPLSSSPSFLASFNRGGGGGGGDLQTLCNKEAIDTVKESAWALKTRLERPEKIFVFARQRQTLVFCMNATAGTVV